MKCKSVLIVLIFAIIISIGSVSAADTNATEIDQIGLSSNEEIISTDSSVNQSSDFVSSSNSTNVKSEAYLVLDNDADKENIYVGDLVTWIVSVQNYGPDVSKNTKVYDKLPDGLQYISHSLTKGVFNPATGIWSIGDLKVEDGEVFLYITCKALTSGEKINKANLTSDTINLNNKSYEEEEIDVLDIEDNNNHLKQSYPTIKKAGNPLFLILVALLGFFVPCFRSKKN
ncbi:MAG: DUF11 domain-containing protein [Methanobrevibacter sp.]|nr:DUF11 domain-containing protein [Methanobrevibacter sp.]MBO6274859.1 DUF11 domain-containing protein [Methanobrevibacter sp.]